MRANERDFYFAIQQRQFAAKMTNRVHLRLLRRITEMFHHRVGQIECCYQFCARLFPDVHRITDVIGMTVRNQDEIDMLERGDFVLRIFENRIREPRIDEQNFSARGHNLESRLTVPSELRIHGNHQIENRWSSKRNAVSRSDGFPAVKFQIDGCPSRRSLDFRHSTFAIHHFTYDSPHESRSRASAHFKKSPAHGAVNQTIAAI